MNFPHLVKACLPVRQGTPGVDHCVFFQYVGENELPYIGSSNFRLNIKQSQIVPKPIALVGLLIMMQFTYC
jgi:hypothetical protein